ncbi:MAG: hypothetical protein FJ098_07385, partial [Deltaproteobacteria bacterium]|nr:hypothetical protein [Deltaproteobacteria bacterium]
MENGKPVPPSMVMCICPRCERPAGDDACPGCGQALDKRDGLLIVLIDKVTDKDRELLGRVATGFTAGTWEPKKGRLVCRTPEEWATLADSAGRLLRRKGTDLLGPTGLRFDPDDPVLRCLATRKTSALRTCMTQGLGDSYCAALPGLLPLADEPGHLSLSDGLVARGLDATRLVAAVLHGLCEKEHSPLRCPLFASALQGVPVGTALLASMEEALADHPSNVVLPVAPAEAPPGAPPGAPAWTEVPLPPVTARETLQPVGPRPEGPLTWAAGLEDGVFADRDGSPLLLA